MGDVAQVPKLLRTALGILQGEREKLTTSITAVEGTLSLFGGKGVASGAGKAPGRSTRRPMSAAERKAVSKRMTLRWRRWRAARRKAA